MPALDPRWEIDRAQSTESRKRRNDSQDLPLMIKVMRVADSYQHKRITVKEFVQETPEENTHHHNDDAAPRWLERVRQRTSSDRQFSCQPVISPLKASLMKTGSKVSNAQLKQLLGLSS
mmetsp:Transcript_4905/g.7428  ORF Transcript_4905/g.7428 Transcript_4905/m.7428 type:complete len:119 (-) Transcript_4905:37-393(-)